MSRKQSTQQESDYANDRRPTRTRRESDASRGGRDNVALPIREDRRGYPPEPRRSGNLSVYDDEDHDEEDDDLYAPPSNRRRSDSRPRFLPRDVLTDQRPRTITNAQQIRGPEYRSNTPNTTTRDSDRNVNVAAVEEDHSEEDDAIPVVETVNDFQRYLLALPVLQYDDLHSFLSGNLDFWASEDYESGLKRYLDVILKPDSLNEATAWHIAQLLILLSGRHLDPKRSSRKDRLNFIKVLADKPKSSSHAFLDKEIVRLLEDRCKRKGIKAKLRYTSLAQVDAATRKTTTRPIETARAQARTEAMPPATSLPTQSGTARHTSVAAAPIQRQVRQQDTVPTQIRQTHPGVQMYTVSDPAARHGSRNTSALQATYVRTLQMPQPVQDPRNSQYTMQVHEQPAVRHQGQGRSVTGTEAGSPDVQPEGDSVGNRNGLFSQPGAPLVGPSMYFSAGSTTSHVPGGPSLAGPYRFAGPSTGIEVNLKDPKDQKRLKGFLADFKVHEGKAEKQVFQVGSMVAVFWHENLGKKFREKHGDKLPAAGRYGPGFLAYTTDQQPVFSHVRRFIVMRVHQGFSVCIPITTYGGRGVTKSINKSERQAHARIYSVGKEPEYMEGEDEKDFILREIAVVMRVTGEDLSPSSRLYYAKIQSIDHNIKIKHLGQVRDNHMHRLKAGFTQVFNGNES